MKYQLRGEDMRHRTGLRVRALGAVILLPLFALAGVGSTPAAQLRPGSIYQPSRGPVNLISDKTARRRGDLITVLITESQNVKNEEVSRLQRTSSLDLALTSFNLKPDAFNVPLDLQGESSNNFNGRANYEKKGSFTARITAMIMDVLPNGNLVLQGRREIRIDNETKVIEFSGIVRRFDVAADNTVQSELVAEARVSYAGEGDLTNATQRGGFGGWLNRALMWLWPF